LLDGPGLRLDVVGIELVAEPKVCPHDAPVVRRQFVISYLEDQLTKRADLHRFTALHHTRIVCGEIQKRSGRIREPEGLNPCKFAVALAGRVAEGSYREVAPRDETGLRKDSPAAFLAWLVLSLVVANAVAYLLSFTVPDMVGGSVFIIVLGSTAIWRARKRAHPEEPLGSAPG